MKPRTFKLLRAVHRWAGLFFAPLIVLFALSGLLQTLHADAWTLPEWLINILHALEDAHQRQRLVRGTTLRPVATTLIVAMAATLIVSTVIGVTMTYAMYPRHKWRITAALIAGIAIPCLVLLL